MQRSCFEKIFGDSNVMKDFSKPALSNAEGVEMTR